jgi:hypothetical protein
MQDQLQCAINRKPYFGTCCRRHDLVTGVANKRHDSTTTLTWIISIHQKENYEDDDAKTLRPRARGSGGEAGTHHFLLASPERFDQLGARIQLDQWCRHCDCRLATNFLRRGDLFKNVPQLRSWYCADCWGYFGIPRLYRCVDSIFQSHRGRDSNP